MNPKLVATTAHPRRRPVIRLLAALVIVTFLIAGAFAAWGWYRQPARLAAALPAVPDLAGRPLELSNRIRDARTATAARATAWDGVAELGRLYHANGFTGEAEVCWRLLRDEQPREARWLYYLADLRQSANDYAGVIRLLERTTQLAPTYAPAWLRLGDLQFKRGQLNEAARAYRQRLELQPDDPYARLGLARVFQQQGRRDRARQEIEQLVRDAPGFPPGHNFLAQILVLEGNETDAARERVLGSETRFREADDPWLDGLIDWCFDYERLCRRGTVEIQTGRSEQGRELFQRAIALRPDALPAYELLGNAWLDAHDGAKAREAYELGLRSAPQATPTAEFFANLSRAFLVLQQPADAARIARDALARQGEAFSLYDALGDALDALGEHEAAVKALQAAAGLRPADANAHYKLAVALVSVGRLDEAMAALRRSHAAQPTFPPTLALLAQVEMDSGHWPEALQYLQPLFDANPTLPEAREKMTSFHLRAGVNAEQFGDVASAEEHFRAGLAITPEHAELQARLGAILLIQRRFADAIAPLEAFHRLAPDNPQSALFLGQAYAANGRRAEARQILTAGAELADRSGLAATAQHCRDALERLP